MNTKQALGFVILALIVIVLLAEIADRLAYAKIIVAIPSVPDNVIDGSVREVPDAPESD